MVLVHDIVRHAGALHTKRGHAIDREEEKEIIRNYFRELGYEEGNILESIRAIAPECLCSAKGVWWLTLIHPTRLRIYPDRIVYIRKFLFFRRFLRKERAVMFRHIREVEVDEYLFSASVCFRTHRSVEVFCAEHLYKKQSRRAHRIIQALIHDELNHGSFPSGDDFT
jgi:hypothetical protein